MLNFCNVKTGPERSLDIVRFHQIFDNSSPTLSVVINVGGFIDLAPTLLTGEAG